MRSEQINELAGALAKAQSKITNPAKNKSVSVRTKTGGSYEFSYSTLDSVYDAIRIPLTDNGLWPIQTIELGENGKYRLVTMLLHASGQWISSETPLIVEEAGNQKFGSALTFMRRYALTALIGVASDSDDDGNASDGNEITKEKLWSPNLVKPPVPKTETHSGEPRLIPVPKSEKGLSQWTEWGRSLLDALDHSKDESEFDVWVTLNAAALDRMKEVAATTADRLASAIAGRREKLLREPAGASQ